MILGADIGNYYTKTSERISFISKVSKSITNSCEVSENEDFDTEYRKAYKKNYLYLLELALDKSSLSKNIKLVTGLPITQYKEDKEYLINKIITSKLVKDVEVVPEGILCMQEEGIIVDIGGRTTDIALILNEGGTRAIKKPYSMPLGMLNVETDFTNSINSMYGLNLTREDNDRIVREGLFINGEMQEISYESYKNYVNKVTNLLQLNYPLKTHKVFLSGGGAERLFKPFQNRIPQVEIIKDSFFANAYAFYNYGRSIWDV